MERERLRGNTITNYRNGPFGLDSHSSKGNVKRHFWDKDILADNLKIANFINYI